MPRNTSGLRPGWKKGECPNPKGRPPKIKCIADLLRWSGGLTAPENLVAKMRTVFNLPTSVRLTVDQASILAVRAQCLKGSIQHIQFWAERTEGKVKDMLELTSKSKLEIVEEIVDAPHCAPGAAQGDAPAEISMDTLTLPDRP